MATKKKDTRAATSRPKGAVGKNPLVYKAFREAFTPGMVARSLTVLDFGAGLGGVHTAKLRQEGYTSVVAHDLPENMPEEPTEGWVHKPRAHTWDVVLLSNVLNVQESRGDVIGVLNRVKQLMPRHGGVILNFPLSPRKSQVTPEGLKRLLKAIFNYKLIFLSGGTARAPCFYVVF